MPQCTPEPFSSPAIRHEFREFGGQRPEPPAGVTEAGRRHGQTLSKASVAWLLVVQAAHGQIDGGSGHPARLI